MVEQPSDVIPIERSGEFRGRYHVLGGALSPIDGVDPEDLHIAPLLGRVDNGAGVTEVVIATNATTTGEATALYLADALRQRSPDLVVTRLASGLPGRLRPRVRGRDHARPRAAGPPGAVGVAGEQREPIPPGVRGEWPPPPAEWRPKPASTLAITGTGWAAERPISIEFAAGAPARAGWAELSTEVSAAGTRGVSPRLVSPDQPVVLLDAQHPSSAWSSRARAMRPLSTAREDRGVGGLLVAVGPGDEQHVGAGPQRQDRRVRNRVGRADRRVGEVVGDRDAAEAAARRAAGP